MNKWQNFSERKRKYVPYTSSRNRVTYKHPLGKNLYGLNINKEKIAENKKISCYLNENVVQYIVLRKLYRGENFVL